MCEPITALAIASTVAAGASAGASFVGAQQQASIAAQQARDAQAAALANYEMVQEENTRLQVQVNESAAEQKSDRIRQANAELGALRVAADRGLSAATIDSFAGEIGGMEGIDLSRVERQRERDVDALQTRKQAGLISYQSDIATIQNEARAAANQARGQAIGAGLGFIGSGLQIGTNAYQWNTQQNLLQDRR